MENKNCLRCGNRRHQVKGGLGFCSRECAVEQEREEMALPLSAHELAIYKTNKVDCVSVARIARALGRTPSVIKRIILRGEKHLSADEVRELYGV